MGYHITDQDLHCIARRLQWMLLKKNSGRVEDYDPCHYCKYNADCFPYRGMEDFGKMNPNNLWVDKKLQALTGVQLTDRDGAGMWYLLKASVLEEHPLECRRMLKEAIESNLERMGALRRYKMHQEGDGRHDGDAPQ